MSNSNKYAFLGKSFTRFLIMVVIMTAMLIIEKVLNYKYMIAQKAVQEGMVHEYWHTYLNLAILTILMSVVLRAMKVFSIMWIEKVQKVNFFDIFNGVIQEDGKRKSSLKFLTIASAKANCVVEAVHALINIAYIAALMEIVNMTLPEHIGSLSILLCGVAFGILRGRLQAKTDMLGTETESLQQQLSNFFMISSNVLDERLKEIKSNYWRRIILQCSKNVIQVLPDVVKVTFFVALFYNITMLGMEEGKIYPYSYVVYTTYGYMVALASSVSNLLEYLFKIILYKKDSDVEALRVEMEIREEERKNNSDAVIFDSGLHLKGNFSLKLKRPNGKEASYQIPKELFIEEGTAIILEGENGTGKSRLCKFLKVLIKNCVSYDVKTSIVEVYQENFKRGKSEIDFDLIKYLAKGLALERIPERKEDFFNLKCSQLNSADRQMLVALQILYFAIKDFEEGKKQLVILDEIFSNLSLERTKTVLPFIMAELSNIGACTIVVSHTHKDEVKKYMAGVWQLSNTEDEVQIEAIPV